MTRKVFRLSPVVKWVAGSLLAAVFAATLPGGCQAAPQPTPTPEPTPTPTLRLFIANQGGNSVVSYENPSTLDGNRSPDIYLSGAQTQLDGPQDILVNAAGQLIVANFGGSITTYDDAEETNGNFAPDGNMKGPATGLINPVSLALSPAEDLLFVADFRTSVILVYANTSPSALNGNTAPIRTITTATSGELDFPTGISLDANGNLYVANNGDNNILVFANAGALNGDVTPTRTITSNAFNDVYNVFIAGDDRMYVVDVTGRIFGFSNAASLNGNQDPVISLAVNPATFITAIAVDSTGTGYILDFEANAVFVYDNIATLYGFFDPDRTIRGSNTNFNQPIRMFLVESVED